MIAQAAVELRPFMRFAQQIIPEGWSLDTPSALESLDFRLPAELEAGEPPEVRGLARDQVRLMVSCPCADQIHHTTFRQIGDYLSPGDVLVVNTSGTMNAALPAHRVDGAVLELHLSTHLPGDLWTVELRRPTEAGTEPFFSARAGETLRLPEGGAVQLLLPYRLEQRFGAGQDGRVRLWLAAIQIPGDLNDYLDRRGFPIRYKYVREGWPIEYYQTVYASERGSAEMPSAGRAFSAELITQLTAKGIQILPLTLHTGVASLEEDEWPYEEYFRVPADTARGINQARAADKQIIAVGTTVLRALESTISPDGQVHPAEGWTSLVITPERRIRAADGLLTGMHEPRSTHLSMLAALAGFEHLQLAYAQALENGYLWHEFGDLHLILSGGFQRI